MRDLIVKHIKQINERKEYVWQRDGHDLFKRKVGAVALRQLPPHRKLLLRACHEIHVDSVWWWWRREGGSEKRKGRRKGDKKHAKYQCDQIYDQHSQSPAYSDLLCLLCRHRQDANEWTAASPSRNTSEQGNCDFCRQKWCEFECKNLHATRVVNRGHGLTAPTLTYLYLASWESPPLCFTMKRGRDDERFKHVSKGPPINSSILPWRMRSKLKCSLWTSEKKSHFRITSSQTFPSCSWSILSHIRR